MMLGHAWSEPLVIRSMVGGVHVQGETGEVNIHQTLLALRYTF